MEEFLKICSKCGEEKSCNDFHKDAYKKDGYKGVCKNCHNKQTKERKETKMTISKSTSNIEKKVEKKIDPNLEYVKIYTDICWKCYYSPKDVTESERKILAMEHKYFKMNEIYNEGMFPPTNNFYVCELFIPGQPAHGTCIGIIKSELQNYLMQQKGLLLSGEIAVSKKIDYINNRAVCVNFPE
jgi:hypothetical protein